MPSNKDAAATPPARSGALRMRKMTALLSPAVASVASSCGHIVIAANAPRPSGPSARAVSTPVITLMTMTSTCVLTDWNNAAMGRLPENRSVMDQRSRPMAGGTGRSGSAMGAREFAALPENFGEAIRHGRLRKVPRGPLVGGFSQPAGPWRVGEITLDGRGQRTMILAWRELSGHIV